MSDKHTPGPWRVQATGNSFVVEEHTHTEAISVDENGNPCRWSEYNESNARLIAAAPELLDALRMWLDIHDTPAGFAGKYGKALDAAIAAQQLRVEAAASAARAAIAKATESNP